MTLNCQASDRNPNRPNPNPDSRYAFVQERREYAKLSPSLRALVLQRLCEANMEARDHVRTWMTDDTEVDDLRCEVTHPAQPQIHSHALLACLFSSEWLPLSLAPIYRSQVDLLFDDRVSEL